ncbi:MAG: type II toxin-antitoxin system RelE/ParE family toxin [Rickettsiales bacterium]
MARYKITARAKDDLWRIYNYGLSEYGEERADRYHRKLFEHFEQIAENPYIHPSVNYICAGYRRGVCGVDSIFYRVTDDGVEIISIIGRQDIKNILL